MTKLTTEKALPKLCAKQRHKFISHFVMAISASLLNSLLHEFAYLYNLITLDIIL